MAMLESEAELTLSTLNNATISWVELEYHRKVHAEIATTPLDRYLNGKNVGRDCPALSALKQAFCNEVRRKQRRSDGTFTLEGVRFEIPAPYRFLEQVVVRYARWDLSRAILVDPNTHACLTTLYPQDKLDNAKGLRRSLPVESQSQHEPPSGGMAPLLKDLMAQYAATGLPPAYISTEHNTKKEDN